MPCMNTLIMQCFHCFQDKQPENKNADQADSVDKSEITKLNDQLNVFMKENQHLRDDASHQV